MSVSYNLSKKLAKLLMIIGESELKIEFAR